MGECQYEGSPWVHRLNALLTDQWVPERRELFWGIFHDWKFVLSFSFVASTLSSVHTETCIHIQRMKRHVSELPSEGRLSVVEWWTHRVAMFLVGVFKCIVYLFSAVRYSRCAPHAITPARIIVGTNHSACSQLRRRRSLRERLFLREKLIIFYRTHNMLHVF